MRALLLPHDPAYPVRLACIAVIIAALRGAIGSPAAQRLDVALVAIALLLLGVPHGALDHHVSSAVRRAHSAAHAVAPLRFYAWYVALVVAYAACWAAAPRAAAAAFAVLTALHFGETDVEAIAVGCWSGYEAARSKRSASAHARALAHMACCGGAVTLALLCVDPAAAIQIGEAMIGTQAPFSIVHRAAQMKATARALLAAAPALAAVALLHPSVIAWARPGTLPHPPPAHIHNRWAGFTALLLVLCIVGAVSGAALPFVVYFAAWHSAQAFAHIATVVHAPQLRAAEAAARSCAACLTRTAAPRGGKAAASNKYDTAVSGRVSPSAGTAPVYGRGVGGPSAASWRLWLHAAPLTLGALAMLPALALAIPALPTEASAEGGPAGSPAVPPLLLVLLAVLTLPHAQVMHASYEWTAARPQSEGGSSPG